ncbi:MAG: tyrosine-type recombinase/integrase [Armatimonadetes bacterium]|nr:tyrosine-type recombinase/integrase [Anaerolineae bacterium]
MTNLTRRRSSALVPHAAAPELTFNFAAALPGRASSPHTRRAYFRWVDTYLVDLAKLAPSTGAARQMRMAALPIGVLQATLTAAQVRAWLGMLVGRGHGKQGIDQARAALVTLADLLAEAEWLDDYAAAALARVRPPRAEDGQRPGRWLALDQLQTLMHASRLIATSDEQATRNHIVTLMLCTMALRREELARAKWGDLSMQNNRAVLKVHGKGRKVATIDVPRSVVRPLEVWRGIVARSEYAPVAESALIRRIWKGGRVARRGLTPDGIWWIIGATAAHADLGHVAPHDLRRSVAGALHEAGTPIETISKLLRHSNVTITERYLNRLPQANQGAVLMSDILGLEDDAEDA